MTYDLINHILSDTTDKFFEKPYFITEKSTLGPQIVYGFSSEKTFILYLFNENDSLNLFAQFKLRKEFLIDSSKIKDIKLVPKEYFEKNKTPEPIWDVIDRDYNGGFYSISMPFFSSDNKLVYITIGYTCGWLCGSGHSRLYKYNNERWELLKKFGGWKS